MFPSSMWLGCTSQRAQTMMFHRNLPSKFVISTLPSSQVRTYWITVRFLVLLFLERLHLQSSVNKDRRSLPRNPEERRRRRTQARVVIVAITFKYFEEANVIWVLWLVTHGGGPTGRDDTQSFPDQRKQGLGTCLLLVLALCFVALPRRKRMPSRKRMTPRRRMKPGRRMTAGRRMTLARVTSKDG